MKSNYDKKLKLFLILAYIYLNMIDIISWDKLKPYNSTQNKSFEELCFQICLEEYKNEGRFNRIDDSGGGDGVEFYLELTNGDIWGWQCKFFGRFDEGGRKEQIKKSLHTAYNKHGNKLKRWILCSKNSLTNEEKKWFDGVGNLKHNGFIVLPTSSNIIIDHWGDSIILNLLRKHPSIYKFFFSDKILDENWFKEKFELIYNSNVIKSKYLDSLHVKGEVDDFITSRLGGKELVNLIEKNEDNIGIYHFQKEFNGEINRIRNEENKFEFNEIYQEIKSFIFENKYDTIVNDGAKLLNDIKSHFLADNYKLSVSLETKIEDYKNRYRDFYEAYMSYKNSEKLKSIHWDNEELEKNESSKDKIKKCRETLLGPYFTLRNYDYFLGTFEELITLKSNEVHINGNASKGKTHISVDIVKKQLDKNKPAVFVFGKSFKSDLPLKEQLRSILDLPTDWTISDFLSVLDIAGRIKKTKAILLIDGLNEAVKWKFVWGDNLEELINEINAKYPNILFITTFRTSYKKELFPKDYFNYDSCNYAKLIRINGFTNYNLNEAMDKYFKYYNITLIHSSEAVNAFSEPLYLKIFCETKQGKSVSFQNEDLFDVFEEYLIKCNENISEKLGKELRFNKNFTINILEKISKSLWENSSREIDFEYAIHNIFDQEEFLVFEKEDLLIFRDWNNVEVITFTYDLLSGYLIAKNLFKSIDSEEKLNTIIKSTKFKNELLNRKTCHPLFNDILRSFCVLAIKKFGLNFYSSIKNETLNDYLLKSIFEVNQKKIIDNKSITINIIKENFKDVSKHNLIYSLFKNTDLDSQNPLNINLLSDLLFNMKVSERDLSWTEHIRSNNYIYDKKYRNFLIGFEEASKSKRKLRTDKIHLAAKKTMWFLTSTNREFRDLSTRALYYYGRKFSNEYLELVKYSLSVNDPYIWERTLAALYGVVMAKHNNDENFKKKLLPKIVLCLFELIFKNEAPFATTHILARDYASKIIEIGLLHHNDLLKPEEILLTTAPFTIGGNRNPNEFDYEKKEGIFSEPISMDFSNYTIGRIVEGGHSYSDPPEKKKVRRQIYARIYELGWNEAQFNEIDGRIRSESYRSRTEQAHTERYGKKYSWIAYFEIAGLRIDNKLIEDDWDRFRFSDADIDPSFPERAKNKKFVLKDYLGDSKQSLLEWYINGGKPDINEYLKIDKLKGHDESWICLDGFIVQERKKINREVFVFIRGLLVKNDKYEELKKLLIKKKDIGGRFLPDPRSNYYSFAGELYCIRESVADNSCIISFEANRKTVKVKKGDPGYFARPVFDKNKIKYSYPEFIEIDSVTYDEYEVLLPVMDYSWESNHSELNQAGHETVISKELANSLNLINKPQTFDLFDDKGNLASHNLFYKKNYNNNHRFTYLRKDLLDKFLLENDYKLIWGIWGERNVRFKDIDYSRKFHRDNKVSDLQIFSDVIEYK
ncbi:NACHT domain-containing protein [Flavobacterium commune]|nr:hypothetical protein [Flavobacterium commune]